MLIIPLFIVLLLGFITCFKNAGTNITVIQHDWEMPTIEKIALLAKSLGWAALGFLAAGGLLQAVFDSQV